ncbi:unnamed protein product [Penicillium palitans]
MAETSADAPFPPPPPPPPKSNKEKKKEWEATVQEGRARIETIFNAMLDHYNAMGGENKPAAGSDAIRVLRELAEELAEERNPHTHVKKE